MTVVGVQDMAHIIEFNNCQMELEFENIEEGGTKFTRDPELATRRIPEMIEMEMFQENRDHSQIFQASYDTDQEFKPLLRHRWSAATLKVLSSLPSRSVDTGSHCREAQELHTTQEPQVAHLSESRPPIHGVDIQADCEERSEESKREQLVTKLQSLSLGERVRGLQTMTISLTEKIQLRTHAFGEMDGNSLSSRNAFCDCLRMHIVRMSPHCLFSYTSSLQFWHLSLKRLCGHFGSTVLSYFIFIRTLLLLNTLLVIINGLFLVIPQAIYPSSGSSLKTFTGIELLTATGFLSHSIMFYGYYNNTIIMSSKPAEMALGSSDKVSGRQSIPYNISLAYLFTILASFFITCIILVYRLSKSFGASVLKSENLAGKVFCAWDFKVSKNTSVQRQSENISTQLKELLTELTCKVEEKSIIQRLKLLVLHVLAWVLCIASIFLGSLAIYHITDYYLQDQTTMANVKKPSFEEAKLLLLPTVVSCINLLLPGFFNVVSSWTECYDSTRIQIYVSIFRNLLLKVSVLGMLCYRWLGRIVAESQVSQQCWETFVGQELYCFLVMDFICTMLYTFFGEFLWRLVSKKVLKQNRKPMFDIARNVLELIYGQTLTWIGVLFSPLLPAVQMLKLLVLFHVKKSSLMQNCQVSRKPLRASQMTTLFIALLFFPFFLGAAVAVSYTISTIKPSSGCGPFRNSITMFRAGKLWLQSLENTNLSWLNWAYTYLVDNPLCLYLAAGVFLMIIYIYIQVLDGQKRMICLLEKHIENEGKDKQFLINKLQAISEGSNLASTSRLKNQ